MSIKRIELLQKDISFSSMAWGLGSMPAGFTAQQVLEMLNVCVDCGITTIDNAENYLGYSGEKLLGDALHMSPGLRNKIELVTKCGCVGESPRYPEYYMYHYDTSKKHIIEAAENSLKNFRVDYIDSLLLHRPDPLMDVEEVASAFESLKKSGKVRSFGVSNFLPEQLRLLQAYLDFPLIVNEVQMSVLYLDNIGNGTIEYAKQVKMPLLVWGPLGRGRLFNGNDEQALRVISELEKVCYEIGECSIDQVALAWLMKIPSRVIPLLGADKPEYIYTSATAASIYLTRQQWFRIMNASLGHSMP